MKDDKVKRVAFLYLSVHLLLSAAHTDLWDKEEEAFVDSISFKNSRALWEEERKSVTMTYVSLQKASVCLRARVSDYDITRWRASP